MNQTISNETAVKLIRTHWDTIEMLLREHAVFDGDSLDGAVSLSYYLLAVSKLNKYLEAQ